MLPDLGYVERHFSRELGVRVFVHRATTPLHPSELNPRERHQYDQLSFPARQRDWLLGRHALRRLLRRMDLDPDTSALAFPHPRLSLTHNHGVAVAAGTRASCGLGIDLQIGRSPREAALRFYLQPGEQNWIRQEGVSDDALRLWTIKEAVLKSDPENHGRLLREYVVREPDRWVGSAFHHADTEFLYSSMAVESGFLTAAVRKESRHVA